MSSRRATDEQIGYLVKQLQQQVRAALDDALAAHGVTMSTYAVLAVLHSEGGLSNAELARRCFVTAQSMNRLVQDLASAGLVSRVGAADHGRIIHTDLTPRGTRLLARCQPAVDRVQDRMLSDLSSAEQAAFADLLHRCSHALSADPA